MTVTRKILGFGALKPNSIGFEALMAIGWRISLIIAILSAGSYVFVQQLLETQVINKLEIAVEARAHREGELFRNIEQANENAKLTLQALLENQGTVGALAFDDVFTNFGDNTYRTKDSIYNGTVLNNGLFVKGSAGFIPEAATFNDEQKNLMAAAVQTVVQVGSAYYPQFESYYFYTPKGHLFVWAPDRPGNLMFYRKEAAADFSIAEFEVVQITLPENNPDRSFVCTSLQPIIDASTGASWTRGCQIPFDYNGQHIGGFGSTMRLQRVLGGTTSNALVGGEHMIISSSGMLLEHPRLTQSGSNVEANLDILNSQNDDIKNIYHNIQRQTGKQTWVSFSDETDSYIAASEIYGLGGYYVISFPRALIAAEAGTAAFNILYLGLGAMLIALFTLATTMRRTVTEPLNQLIMRTKQLSLGKFDSSTEANALKTSEIGTLAASTEKMANELAQIIGNLEKTVEERTKDLEAARIEAEKASAAKTVFLANMSHEIRTPLTGVIGMLDLLSDENLNPSAMTYLDMAQKSSGLLLNLVNDILDISRLEAGKYSVRLSAINLNTAVRDTADSLALLARQKHLKLKVIDTLPTEFWVLTDIKIIRQILINLVGNAIKFTETGGVTVALAATTIDPETYEVSLTVSDTGKGLTEDQIKDLFERFEQVQQADDSGPQGTGLGLAIVKELTALLGGTITCKSKPDKGSDFFVTLPMHACKPVKHTQTTTIDKQAKALTGVRLLGVDDNPINRMIIQRVCEQMGAKITMTDSGANMIAELSAQGATQQYDALLMDINMPGLNGIETLAAIRALPGDGANLPAIALTADAIEGTEARMRAAGMNGYVTKPIEASVLQNAILTVIKNKTAAP